MAGGRRRLCARRRYEDTAEAAKRAEQRNLYRVLFSAGFFFFGLWWIGYSGRRDKADKGGTDQRDDKSTGDD